jgi:uncharacterized membrane protein
MTFLQDQRGSIAIMSAFFALIACVLAALAVDIGSVALDARRLQGAADLAAMAAAADLDNAQTAADLTAAANNSGSSVAVNVVVGTYVADPAIAPTARFTPDGSAGNAVRVTLQTTSPIYFGSIILGKDSISLQRSATAALDRQPRAMFSIGSRLARLDRGVANQLLSGLTGSTVSLSVMDYQALASTQVNLLAFSDALATDLGVTAGDYDALLSRTVDAGRALKVIETLAGDQPDSALSKLADAATGIDLNLGQLIGVEAGAPEGLGGALDASVSALDLTNAILEIAGGDRQLALSLDAPVGVAELKTWLAIGERPNRSPWLAVTRDGAPIIRTAQARLYVRVRTSQKLAGLAQVNLPILIELASSEARLDSIDCDPKRSVTLGVRPGLAKASIGVIDESALDDFKTALRPATATVVSVAGLVKVNAKAQIEAEDQTFTPVHFGDADIRAQTRKSVHTTGMVNGIVASLLRDMEADVNGLDLGGLIKALGVLLTPLGPPLDATINPVLEVLGLKFGEADVQVHDVKCEHGLPSLVG